MKLDGMLPDFRENASNRTEKLIVSATLNQTVPELNVEERTVKIGRDFLEAGNERTRISMSDFPKQCESY